MTSPTDSIPYALPDFIAVARRIMETPTADADRAAAVRALEPLLRRALAAPGWDDPRYAATTDSGRPGFEYYRNPVGSLHIYGVLFTPHVATPIHDHTTWGLIGVASGHQRTTRYRRLDDGSVPGQCTVQETNDDILTPGDVYAMLPPHDIHRIEVVSDQPGLSIHVLGADPTRQRRRIFDVEAGTCEEVAGVSMAR